MMTEDEMLITEVCCRPILMIDQQDDDENNNQEDHVVSEYELLKQEHRKALEALHYLAEGVRIVTRQMKQQHADDNDSIASSTHTDVSVAARSRARTFSGEAAISTTASMCSLVSEDDKRLHDLSHSLEGITGADLLGLSQAAHMVNEHARLASQEASTVTEDMIAAGRTADEALQRALKAEKAVKRLHQEKCKLKSQLDQVKLERKVLAREVKTLRKENSTLKQFQQEYHRQEMAMALEQHVRGALVIHELQLAIASKIRALQNAKADEHVAARERFMSEDQWDAVEAPFELPTTELASIMSRDHADGKSGDKGDEKVDVNVDDKFASNIDIKVDSTTNKNVDVEFDSAINDQIDDKSGVEPEDKSTPHMVPKDEEKERVPHSVGGFGGLGLAGLGNAYANFNRNKNSLFVATKAKATATPKISIQTPTASTVVTEQCTPATIDDESNCSDKENSSEEIHESNPNHQSNEGRNLIGELSMATSALSNFFTAMNPPHHASEQIPPSVNVNNKGINLLSPYSENSPVTTTCRMTFSCDEQVLRSLSLPEEVLGDGTPLDKSCTTNLEALGLYEA